MAYNPEGDRRPVAARQQRLIVAVAGWLVRRGASANAISVGGMVAALIGGVLLSQAPGHPLLWIAGGVLIQLRLLANVLDGMVAVGRGIASPTGELFNEIPDRASDTAILLGVGIAAGQAWLGWAAALAAMATAYVRAVGRGLGQQSDFSGPMAKQHRMALLTALCLFCAVAPADWAGHAPETILYVILLLATLTAARRLLRLAAALRGAAS